MAEATTSARWRFWAAAAAVFLLILWLLNDILLPFVVGMVVAYLLDPAVLWLQRFRISRTLATTFVTILAALAAVGATMAVLPPLFGQIQELIAGAPQLAMKAITQIQPLIEPFRERFGLPALSLQTVQAEATQWAGEALAIAGGLAGGMLRGGVAVINVLALLFVTPVVTFYMLRDWEKLLATIDRNLPRDHADTIRSLARQSNRAIGGYIRGQALVCITLGTMYAVGLTLVGLQFGFVIGLIAGAISFIPFVGTFVGAALSVGMALAQFPPDWLSVALVVVVFVVGQALEGNILSPMLVGDRVGLHPVWIMFALLAGGVLFGFVGVLVAVPAAAVVGVIVRHLVRRYRESPIYRGGNTG